MDLTKLFDMQRTLDARIVEQHGLQGQDLLPQKILALQVELGECANEWRGFKFWSKDQTPRTHEPYHTTTVCGGEVIDDVGYSNLLLEEYIDCLHFILSIGLEIYDVDPYEWGVVSVTSDNIIGNFKSVFDKIMLLSDEPDGWNYEQLFNSFAGLGEMLGFSNETIEEAYLNKNKVNHERQDANY